MDLFERLETLRDRWNVLAHPFYTRWERGELTREELSFYAGEYKHAVVALASAAAGASELTGPQHPAQEAEHVALWDDFRSALGDGVDRPPLPETVGCADAWTAGRDPLEALAVCYAIESGQPEIAWTKLEGLVRHYGFDRGSEAVAYFRLHAELDLEHAAEARTLLQQHARPEDSERLVGAAGAALEGNWRLLDGVLANAA
jgi:pyrroloquinoline-quinone synthase